MGFIAMWEKTAAANVDGGIVNIDGEYLSLGWAGDQLHKLSGICQFNRVVVIERNQFGNCAEYLINITTDFIF